MEVLGKLPDASINGVFTSPPYFALRNYDNDEWEGGSADCDHKPEPDKVARRAVSSSRLQGGKSTQADAEAGRSGFDGTCGKCGAHRILRWQGGDPNCEHDRGGRDWTPQTKWQAAGEAVPKQASHRGVGDTCLKCGAVYVNPELGAEQTPDCMTWTRLEEPYIHAEPEGIEIRYQPLDQPRLCGKCYVCRLVAVFREIRRVLRDDGVAWLNLGDTMNGYPANAHSAGPIREKVQHARQMKDSGYGLQSKGLKEPDSIGIPHRVAMALQADGWYWRTSVVWAKISVMPESVGGWRWEQHRVYPESFNRWADEKYGAGNGPRMSVPEGKKKKEKCPGCDKCLPNDGLVLCTGSWRPTHSHEFIIQLAKNPKYFTDPLAVRQLPAEASLKRIRQPNFWLQHGGEKDMRNWDENTSRSLRNGLENFANNPGRNLWDVWVVPPQPVKEAHFATFPGGLPELAIRASISQGGYCNQCGKPFARIVKRDDAYDEAAGISETSESKWVAMDKQSSGHRMRKNVDAQRRKGRDHDNPFPVQQTVGWKPTCKCVDPQPVSGVMLDPFSGSGTTVRVAKALGVRGIGIDLNARYNKIADKLIDSAKLIIQEAHAAQHEQQTLF